MILRDYNNMVTDSVELKMGEIPNKELKERELGTVAHIYNPSTGEAQAGAS